MVLVQTLGYTTQYSSKCKSENRISIRVTWPGALWCLAYVFRAIDGEMGSRVGEGDVSGERLWGNCLGHGICLAEGLNQLVKDIRGEARGLKINNKLLNKQGNASKEIEFIFVDAYHYLLKCVSLFI